MPSRAKPVSAGGADAPSFVRARVLAKTVVGLFLAALAIRWIYAVAMFAAFGVEGLKVGDSEQYLVIARGFVDAISAGTVHGWQWLGPELRFMPLFSWSLAAHVALAGPWAPLTYVFAQGVFDAGTCVVVYGIARTIDERIAGWAGAAAALTPTLIVLSGVVYTDTAFVFFASIGMLGALLWLRAPSWRSAVLIGAALGLAALQRVWIVPWTAPLLVFLAAAALVRRQLSLARLVQLLLAAGLVAVCVAPVLLRNVSVYGAWSLTPQSGAHLALWVVPLVREAKDGTPRAETVPAIEARRAERYGAQPDPNPFVLSSQFAAIAEEELARLGTGAVVKAWLFGAAVNVGSPAVTIVPAVANLPRSGFYDTPGRDFADKVATFLFRSENALYAWLLIAGIAGVACFRLLQLAGGLVLLFQKGAIWPLLLMLGWIGYVLLLNGPIASPKYRLPFEPQLAVLSGAALARLSSRRGWRSGAASR